MKETVKALKEYEFEPDRQPRHFRKTDPLVKSSAQSSPIAVFPVCVALLQPRYTLALLGLSARKNGCAYGSAVS